MSNETLSLRVCPPASKQGLDLVLQGEYDVPGLDLESPIVLDIGANIGAFAVWAAARWQNATIFCYEPNPESFAMLEQNAPENAKLNRCAVSNADGKAPLFIGLHNLGECSLVNVGEQDMTKAGIVRLIHARHLPECDVLKIDTEGSERVILDHYPHLGACRAVMLEWHSQDDRRYIRNKLVGMGFVCVFDREWCPERGVQKFVRPPSVHLFVAVLSGGGKICVDNLTCMQTLMRVGPECGVRVTIGNNGGTGVDRARNRSVEQALSDPSITHFLFVDDDIVFDPSWVVNMIRSGLDVTAGAYPRKQISWEMVKAAVERGVPLEELPEHASNWIINFALSPDGSMGGFHADGIGDFMEVEEAGTGFLMMKREVLERMLKAYATEMSYLTDYEPRGVIHHMMFACQRDPNSAVEQAKRRLLTMASEFGRPFEARNSVVEAPPKPPHATIGDLLKSAYAYADVLREAEQRPELYGRYLTEDYAWCRLWRMLGGKIHLYLDAKLKHIGIMTFEGAARHYFKPAPEAQTSETKA